MFSPTGLLCVRARAACDRIRMGSHTDHSFPPPPRFSSEHQQLKLIFNHSWCFQLHTFSSTFFSCLNSTTTIIPVLFYPTLCFLFYWHYSRAASIFSSFSLSQVSVGQSGWGKGNVCTGMDPVYTQEMLNCGTNCAIWEKVQRISEPTDVSEETMNQAAYHLKYLTRNKIKTLIRADLAFFQFESYLFNFQHFSWQYYIHVHQDKKVEQSIGF